MSEDLQKMGKFDFVGTLLYQQQQHTSEVASAYMNCKRGIIITTLPRYVIKHTSQLPVKSVSTSVTLFNVGVAVAPNFYQIKTKAPFLSWLWIHIGSVEH